MSNGNFVTKNLTVVLGGCNLSGYFSLDKQDIFSTELAIAIQAIVYGAQGYTKPVHNSSKRKSRTWIKTDSDGNRTDLKKNTIDLANPEDK